MKRILIPYFSAGYGHVSFAKAIKHFLQADHPDWEIRLFDPGAELPNQKLNTLYVDNWKKILAMPGPIKTALFAVEPLFASLSQSINDRYINQAKPAAAQFLLNWQPDAIIPTHWGCANLFDQARRDPLLAAGKKPAIWYVYTELGGAYQLINCGADIYFALTDEAGQDLRRVGVADSTIVPVGLVVQPEIQVAARETNNQPLKEAARLSLGLNANLFTVVFSLGGEGLGRAMDFLQAYYKKGANAQIIVLTGKNRRLFDQIGAELPPRPDRPLVKPFAHLPDLITAFQAADILAGKCGTSFAMETVKMYRPLLVCQLGAPNEKKNMEYLVRHGFGWYVPRPAQFVEKIERLGTRSTEWQASQAAFRAVGTDNGAQTIAQFVGSYFGAKELVV
jgi:UDP-N-acetylglucosamine:LPS N-acetylglucosamine transferase